jgi:hypothetical protein
MLLLTDKPKPEIGMISTTNKNQLQIVKQSLINMYEFHQEFGNFQPVKPFQHLYIVDDSEIKEGDWFLYKEKIIFHHDGSMHTSSHCKKIIATTDKLTYKYNELGNELKVDYFLPQPSQQFIDKYIEQYNKGNIITDVMVEYEHYCKDISCGKNSCYLTNKCENLSIKLKVDSNNCITITKCKPTLKELCKQDDDLKKELYSFACDPYKTYTKNTTIKKFIEKFIENRFNK